MKIYVLSLLSMLLIVFLVDDSLLRKRLDVAHAESADLRKKLEAQATEQISCLKDNINLITWKVNAQMIMLEAGNYLSFCADHVPGRKFPHRRKRLDLDDSFVGAEVFPPL
jgi:hypothetical protein